MLGVGEDGVFLFGNPHARELARQVGEVGDLDAGDVVEIAGIVAVTANAIGDRSNARGNVGDLLVEALPQSRNGRAVVETEGRELLETAGFVRDYQGMTLYAAWR